MSAQVLFVYNDPIAHEAVLGDIFTERGFDVSSFNVVPVEQVDAPAEVRTEFPDPTRYDVIVPLGSRWSVYDPALRAAWVDAEAAMVRDAVDAGVGVLGVCFGGQLVAQALGGTVAKAPLTELGWYELSWTSADHSGLIPSGPWFEWHSDQFTPPPGATELARTAQSSQAFVQSTALGLQFHPELNVRLLDQWLDDDRSVVDDRQGDVARLGLDEDELRARTKTEQDGAAQRLRALVSSFLDHVARPVRQL